MDAMVRASLQDVARVAGVSLATVDRVLNKRPGVNAETVQRVLQVVAELGSPPQRGRPRKGENFRFAFVLPAEPSPFVELVDRLIAQAAGEFRHQHITEVTRRLPSQDPAAFADELAHLADMADGWRRDGPWYPGFEVPCTTAAVGVMQGGIADNLTSMLTVLQSFKG